MKIIEISAAQGCAPTLALGKRGENLATEVRFDFTSWLEEFGEGRVELYARRCGDENAYPVTATVDGTTAVWTLTATDTHVVGYGTAEFVWVAGETVVKSVVFGTIVEPDIGAPTDTPPEPYESWLDTLTELAADTQEYAERAETAQGKAEDAQAGAEAAQTATEEALGPVEADVTDLQALTAKTIGQIDIRELPAGYRQMWYLETDGHARIDTGIGWKDHHPRIVLDVQSSGGHLFGESATSSARICGGIGYPWWYRTQQVDASVTAGYARQRVTTDYSDTFLKVNGSTVATFDATGVTGSANTMTLFGSRSDGSGVSSAWANAGTRIYSAKIYKTISGIETLVLDAVPCIREADDAVGFYDLAGESFLGVETGTITAAAIPNLSEVTDRTTALENDVAALDAGKADATYSYALPWADIFGTDSDVYGWQNGYYNNAGTPSVSPDHRCLRTIKKRYYVAPEGVEKIVFSVPAGFHARITEFDASGTFVRNVGNYSSGSNVAEIVPTEGYKYAFCYGEYSDAYPEITEELVATLTATIRRSVESRDEEQNARLTVLERGDGIDALPGYWKPYLLDRISAITDIQRSISPLNDAFMFVTDYHIRTNQRHSLDIIREVATKTGITRLFFGGDAGGKIGPSDAQLLKALQQNAGIWASMSDCVPEFYGSLGNHEWIGGIVSRRSAVIAAYLNRYKTSAAGCDPVEGNYFVDNKSNKIRYFFLQQTISAHPALHTLLWLGDCLLETGNDWTTAVTMHHGWIPSAATFPDYGVPIEYSYTSIKGVNQMLAAWRDKQAFTWTWTESGVQYSRTFNFDTAPETDVHHVLGIFCGHLHHGTLFTYDNEYNTYGVPVFRGSTDAMQAATVPLAEDADNIPWYWKDGIIGGTKVPREIGTTSEQCVYVVQVDLEAHHVYITTIGGDNDWEFDYEA